MEYLSLTSNGDKLSGEIPTQLGELTGLTYLALYANGLTGEIPSELGSLTDLTYLGLPSNNLSGEIPSELGQLTLLDWLALNDNALTGTVPTEFVQLTNLVNLQLHKNQLTEDSSSSSSSSSSIVSSEFCASPFPDWRGSSSVARLSADCISEVECDCCNVCYDDTGRCFAWSNNDQDYVLPC